MFRGTKDISLDDKGRMAMPTRYRDVFEERSDGKLFITVSRHDLCLSIYAATDWLEEESSLTELDGDDPDRRLQDQMLVGHAHELELDSSGRVVIPSRLREYAELEKRAVMVGQGTRLALWSEAKWNRNVALWRERHVQGLGA